MALLRLSFRAFAMCPQPVPIDCACILNQIVFNPLSILRLHLKYEDLQLGLAFELEGLHLAVGSPDVLVLHRKHIGWDTSFPKTDEYDPVLIPPRLISRRCLPSSKYHLDRTRLKRSGIRM